MKSYMLVPALLLLAATACSDSVSAVPQELQESFTIHLPKLKQLAGDATSAHYWDEGPDDGPGGGPGGGPPTLDIPPGGPDLSDGKLITMQQVDVGFLDHDLRVAFGQALGESMGSFYNNTVLLTVRLGDAQIAQQSAKTEESCWCIHHLNPWGETATVTIPLASACGHVAHAKATHLARLDVNIPTLGLLKPLLDDRDDSAFKYQPACPPPVAGGGPGGGDLEDGEGWQMCYWYDYYDQNGRWLRRQVLGCYPM